MDKQSLKVNNSIIRISGIFESDLNSASERKFKEAGYIDETIKDQQFHKNYWYPEFRDIFFRKENKETAARILVKSCNEKVTFLRRNHEKEVVKKTQTTINSKEVYLFPNGLHFFSISFDTTGLSLVDISDLTLSIRNFTAELEGYKESEWVKWVENEVIAGIKIYSTWDQKTIPVDEYSGSKFKLYSVVDLEPNDSINQQVIDELLYDIGCVAKIGSAGGKEYFSPSESYYNLLLKDKISAFNNYAMLPLFDTFTTVGFGILSNDFSHITYNETYFRIYLFNLFIKYNLYRYNSDMRLDSVKTRNQFEKFLNNYNISTISYNFLPNLIFEKHRKSMLVEEELAKFEERINRISQSIQEDQQNRMNTLIGIVGLFTSIGSVEPAIALLENARETIALQMEPFYTLVILLLIIIALPILMYLFPEKKKQLTKKWKQRRNSK
jgi:3-dehydroquinate dehydratase